MEHPGRSSCGSDRLCHGCLAKNRWKSDGVTCAMVNMLGYGHATIMPYIMVIPYSNGIIWYNHEPHHRYNHEILSSDYSLIDLIA